jgi:PmbA protein
VPHQVTPLIEAGIVKNFLYDLDAAGRTGRKSTGNGVGCGPTNLVVGAGETPFEEMIKRIAEGLIVHQVLGLGQGNPASGAFSVNVHLGYKIENGQIAGRVKDVMLAGNTYDSLKEVGAVGDKQEWVGGSLLTPAVLIDGLNVVAK